MVLLREGVSGRLGTQRLFFLLLCSRSSPRSLLSLPSPLQDMGDEAAPKSVKLAREVEAGP